MTDIKKRCSEGARVLFWLPKSPRKQRKKLTFLEWNCFIEISRNLARASYNFPSMKKRREKTLFSILNPMLICWFYWLLLVPRQLIVSKQLIVRFQKFCYGFCKFASFWSNFEQNSVLDICQRNPKQQRMSKKTRLLVSGRSPECSDRLLMFVEQ